MAVTNGTAVEPKSTHVADESLRPFLQPSFDPAAYLNSTLPSLHLPTHAALPKPQNAVPLADLSTQTQTLLSQLNAQAARLVNLLTQLTDEILRSGSRLAYEVEVLRGESSTLAETLNENLKDDVSLFIRTGLSTTTASLQAPSADESVRELRESVPATAAEPDYLTHLRTLSQVRSQLINVTHTFNAAMQWPCPPSDSLSSNLLSVSTSASEAQEGKGREFAERLRAETVSLIVDNEEPREGYEAAMSRVERLRELVGVFRGTGEERVRVRFVDGLAKLAGEKLREVEGRGYSREVSRTGTPRAGGVERSGTPGGRVAEKGMGWLDNLGRIRNGG